MGKGNVYAFLIASATKKESWKRYLNTETGNCITWIENTADAYGSGYCVIAIKAYIEKREETFREIEDGYSEQLDGAQKVFIFHVKTGTTYTNNMSKEKENWYYGVIDLDPKNGDPNKSTRNKLIIEEFKDILLQGIDLTDEKITVGSDEKNPLCRKSGEGGRRRRIIIISAVLAVILIIIAIVVPVIVTKT